MTTETQVAVAGTPASVPLADANSEASNTPQATAAEGDVGKQEQAQATPKTFTQAEVDALVQKRLRKTEQRLHRQYQSRMSSQTQTNGAPKRESFADEEAYQNAQIEHLADQRAAQKLAERQQREQQERVASSFREKAERASERYADFDTVVNNPALQINAAMAEYIAESDLGADLAYHLGKNPELAEDIAEMSPIKAARELARLETELAAKPKANPSKAPAPIKPIGASAATSKSPAEMSDAEYLKWRRKKG